MIVYGLLFDIESGYQNKQDIESDTFTRKTREHIDFREYKNYLDSFVQDIVSKDRYNFMFHYSELTPDKSKVK